MSNKVILLVEDNPSDIALTLRAFNKSHLSNQLIVAEDGEEALDYLFGTGAYAGRDVQDTPTLILLDLKLPKIDGITVLQHIREHELTRHIPVVVLTSSREQEDVAASYNLGANSYIRKPVDFANFAEAIAHLGLYWLVINEPYPLQGDAPQPQTEI